MTQKNKDRPVGDSAGRINLAATRFHGVRASASSAKPWTVKVLYPVDTTRIDSKKLDSLVLDASLARSKSKQK